MNFNRAVKELAEEISQSGAMQNPDFDTALEARFALKKTAMSLGALARLVQIGFFVDVCCCLLLNKWDWTVHVFENVRKVLYWRKVVKGNFWGKQQKYISENFKYTQSAKVFKNTKNLKNKSKEELNQLLHAEQGAAWPHHNAAARVRQWLDSLPENVRSSVRSAVENFKFKEMTKLENLKLRRRRAAEDGGASSATAARHFLIIFCFLGIFVSLGRFKHYSYFQCVKMFLFVLNKV